MINKVLIGLFLGIMLFGIVDANLDTGLVAYYNFSSTIPNINYTNASLFQGAGTPIFVKNASTFMEQSGYIPLNAYWNISSKNICNMSSGENSLGFWVKRNTGGGVLLGKGGNLGGWDLIFSDSSNIRYRERVTESIISDDQVVNGNWYYILLTVNLTSTCLYINGTLETCGALNYPPATDTAYFTIGGVPRQEDYQDVYIDEMGCWNRTLFLGDVVQLYNNGSGLGYYGGIKGINYTIVNASGMVISPICTVLNGTITSDYIYNGNGITDLLTCTLSGYTTLLQPITMSDGNKQFTMNAKAINLGFKLYNGTSQSTSGYWTDGNRTENFTSNNLTLNLVNLQIGKVKIYFGNNTLMNYTQFYDFDNDGVNGVNDNLTLMTGITKYKVYIKVKDDGGNPINDALVRVAYSNPSTGGVYQEMGQRYSGGDGTNGMTYFYVDPNSDLSIRITKDGYTAETKVININTEQYTYSYPLGVTLKRGLSLVNKAVSFVVCQYYNNNSATIPLFIYAPSRTSAKFYTSYSNSNYSISLNSFKNGEYTMVRGVHYCASCTDDLIIYLYVDDEYVTSYTVKYRAETNVIAIPTGLNSDMLRKFAWIGLLLVSGIIGLMLKREDGNSTGKAIFIVGCLVLPIVFYGEFRFLAFIVVVYGVGIILKRWIQE